VHTTATWPLYNIKIASLFLYAQKHKLVTISNNCVLQCSNSRLLQCSNNCLLQCSLEFLLGTSAFICDDSHHQCDDGSKCVLLHWVCDGEYDCDDKSDEFECGEPTVPFIIRKSRYCSF